MSTTCPNCGEHDLSQFHRRKFVHQECPSSETGTTEWEEEITGSAPSCSLDSPCPACGEPCQPAQIICPQCNIPVEQDGED
jgi:hypothetical protein